MKNLRFVLLIFVSQFILMGCGILAKFPIEKKVEIKTMDYTPLVNSKIKRVELTLRGKDDVAIQNFEKIIEKCKDHLLKNKKEYKMNDLERSD